MRLHRFIREITVFPGIPYIEGAPDKQNATHYIVEAQSPQERDQLIGQKRDVFKSKGEGKAKRIGGKVRFFKFPVEAYDMHFDDQNQPRPLGGPQDPPPN